MANSCGRGNRLRIIVENRIEKRITSGFIDIKFSMAIEGLTVCGISVLYYLGGHEDLFQ